MARANEGSHSLISHSHVYEQVQWTIKAKFHYAIWLQTGPKLVADLQRAEIWPII